MKVTSYNGYLVFQETAEKKVENERQVVIKLKDVSAVEVVVGKLMHFHLEGGHTIGIHDLDKEQIDQVIHIVLAAEPSIPTLKAVKQQQ